MIPREQYELLNQATHRVIKRLEQEIRERETQIRDLRGALDSLRKDNPLTGSGLDLT